MYVNSSYNIYVRELIVQHLDANLGLYVDGKLKAGERRVLTTKWVDTRRWKRVKKEKDLIKHSFRKCGLSNNLDGGYLRSSEEIHYPNERVKN